MPVTKVKSRWDSGNLIFHESSSLGTIANILTIGTTAVTIGSATNDIDFSWLGTTTGTFDLDAAAHTLVTTGLDWTITGDIALTGNLTVDIGDVQIGDDDYLMFGDGTGGDVSARWVSGTSILEWLPLTDATGAFVIGNGTKNIDFKVFGASGTGYYLLYDESEDDLILAGATSQLILESTINSNATTTGSIHTLGGLGVALDSFFGGTLSVGTISAINAAGPSVVSITATTTAPTLCPNRVDLTTGIGWAAAELHFVISGVDEVNLSATALSPGVTDSTALGTTALMWSDLFLAAEAVINFNNGDVTITHSAGLLTLSDALTVTGAIIGSTTLAVTSTDATTAGVNAIYGDNDAGAVWTSGNQVGVRGRTTISGANNFVSATGVWAGLVMTTATGAGSGLTCALNAEVSSNNGTSPNTIVYLQSLPGASSDFSDIPYLVFSETRGGATGTGSRYLFEVGHAAAGTIPTIGTGELFYESTLQIAVSETTGNRTNFFIPLSTVEASFTTDMPIATTSTIISTCATAGISCTAATLHASTGRIGRFVGSVANANQGDGYGVFEVQANFSGTLVSGGSQNAFSSWINISGGATMAGATICVQNNGIWLPTGITTSTTDMIMGMRMHYEDTDGAQPQGLHCFSVNTPAAYITSIWRFNAIEDLNSTGTMSGAGVAVPFIKLSNGTVYYVNAWSA